MAIIQVNDAYWHGEGGFCKGYRLHPQAQSSGKTRINFAKKQVHPLKDKSDLTDNVVGFVHRNLTRLAVRADLLPQANVIDEVDAEDWAENLLGPVQRPLFQEAKRLYHGAITMPNVARRNLVFRRTP